MEFYQNIVVGFGKGGKTLAKRLAAKGQKVLVVEESNQMYGGTCINVGCLPSKALILRGEAKRELVSSVLEKNQVIEALRNKNYHMLADTDNIDVITGRASFIDDHILQITTAKETIEVTGEKIFINTGAKTVVPPIAGLKESKYVLDSTTAMNLSDKPAKILILGAGYIGLEFASMFANYGVEVQVLDIGSELVPREDRDIAELIQQSLEDKGVKFALNLTINQVQDGEGNVKVIAKKEEKEIVFEGEYLLVAVGRKPNTDNLGLENTNIKVGARGEIIVDEYLRTTVSDVWALGDVTGGLQFTYISLDDQRIIYDYLFGDKRRTTKNRGVIPYTVFLTPPLSNVGENETALKKRNKKYKVFKKLLSEIPRAKIEGKTEGLFKLLVDEDTKKVLGASLYGIQSAEVINFVSLIMNLDLEYTRLRDGIYTHPTMLEAFNDLLS